jgi:hypothetical protein
MKTLLLQISKYTFINYLRKLFLKKDNVKIDSISNFWIKNTFKRNIANESKVILVECLEDINPNMDSYYKLSAMLSKVYVTKVIALTSYGSYSQTVDFLSNYNNIDSTETVYKVFDFTNRIKALLILIKNMPFIYTNNGFKLLVHNIDIGDLVYDEYLRIAKKETLRKANFLFYIIANNAIYAHLRYAQIISKHKVTDIISIRDTYSHSSYCRASDDLKKITIWKNRVGELSSIRKLNAYCDYNHKAFYFENKHMKYIKEKYTVEEVNKMYSTLLEERAKGDVKTGDAAEVKLAHSQNEIATVKGFLENYNIDQKKTTVVIYAHVFVDAVRYPHKVIFSDHYTWLIETLDFLVKNNNLNIFVKPHPSEELYQLGKNVESVISEFNSKYKTNLVILNKKIESKVINKIADVLITGSGTVSMEAPCEGMKVVTSGSSSYENTNAMFRSETQEEYFNLLENIERLPDLTDQQIFDSKIGFIWLNKIQYVESNVSVNLDRTTSVISRLSKLDKMYKNAKSQDAEPLFQRLLDDRIN